jgi:hypothetical protein
VDDREVTAVLHCLEATDDDGRAVLESARAAIEAPAKTTRLTDFHPQDRAWLIRATDEKLRQLDVLHPLHGEAGAARVAHVRRLTVIARLRGARVVHAARRAFARPSTWPFRQRYAAARLSPCAQMFWVQSIILPHSGHGSERSNTFGSGVIRAISSCPRQR